MKIYVKNIDGITLPIKKTPRSAGYDIKVTSDPEIVGEQNPDGSWNRIDYIEYKTNLFLAPEILTAHLDLRPRSSVSKYNLILKNSIGLLDNDYRGMVMARFAYTWQPEDFKIVEGRIVGIPNLSRTYKKGEDIAQLVGAMTIDLQFQIVDDLNQTQRGEGGFGSTDKTVTSSVAHPTMPLADLYNKLGGVNVKKKYSEEIKERDSQ